MGNFNIGRLCFSDHHLGLTTIIFAISTRYMLDHIYVISYICVMRIDTNTLFTALSNEVRLRCLILMQLEGELCVCELIHSLGLSQPMISRHLALLRDSGLVNDRRSGQWVYYSINTGLDSWAKDILHTSALANCEQLPFSNDLHTLHDMPNRPGAACCA